MAGAGYKLFNTGDVLTAAQVNTYLMEQTVMRFATTTARDTALSGVLAEGMICYIDADNNLYKYTGSAWVNIDSGSTSPLTTKGDLYTYSTTDARLAVGNNGDTLVADSSATTGLRWQAPVAVNPVINGGFDIWQRNTSVAGSATAFTADRWRAYRSTTGSTYSRQTTSDTTNLPFIQYCVRVQRDSGNSAVNTLSLFQDFETVNSIPYAGRTVTVSFYARRGANYSASSNNLTATARTGTGTDQTISSGYTNEANSITTTVSLTTTWTRYSMTGAIPDTATQIGLIFEASPTGTAGAADFYEITGIQLEVGSVATPFRRSGGTLAGELAACQRYYYVASKGSNGTTLPAVGYTATSVYIPVPFGVTMRGTPTMSAATGTNYYVFLRNGASDDFNSVTLDFANVNGALIYNNSEISGTAGHAGWAYAVNASASIAFSAEL